MVTGQPSPATNEFDDVAPDPSSMIESMRAHGYTLPAAVADLIDNSISAKARNVWLRFEWSAEDTWVSIADDGEGMTESVLRNAMRLGSKNPLEERDPGDLGRFGLGMKTASFSQCRRLTVASTPASGNQSIRRWDLDHLARTDVVGWQLLRTPYPGSEARLSLPEATAVGTVVLWEVTDRLASEGEDVDLQAYFLRQVEAVEEHLAMVFHRFLAGPSRRLKIWINGNDVQPWDPFLERHSATTRTPGEPIRLAGFELPVRVTGFVLPHKDKLGSELHKAASGPAGWNAQQGYYLYRNERLILAGNWLGLGGTRPWTQEEHYKLARLQLDIPNSMDHLWQLDVMKSTAQPPAAIRPQLRKLAESVRKDARAVFTHRGRYGGGKKRTEIQRPWHVIKRKNSTSYRIDRKHPLVDAALRGTTDGHRDQFKAMLEVIEETVPVQQIWIDTRTEDPARPFETVDELQLRRIIEVTYRALRQNRGLTHKAAIEQLSRAEEFADDKAAAIIATLKEDL